MFRRITFATIICLSLWSLPHDINALGESAPAFAKCTGATPCRACKNCRYCKHCAKDGGTCGVCKPPKKKP
jgi:hypothetical protein